MNVASYFLFLDTGTWNKISAFTVVIQEIARSVGEMSSSLNVSSSTANIHN